MAELPSAEAAQSGPPSTAPSSTHTPATSTSNTAATTNGRADATAAGVDDGQDEQQTTSAPSGRSREIIAEDAQYAKQAISPSPSRSSLSAALHAHYSPLGTLSPYGAGSPIAGSSGSGANTPVDLSAEDQIQRLRHKVIDLASQVTSLNGKLVASYNRVGNLEDEADQKVMELRNLTSKVEKLEAERKIWEDKYEGGLLVEKAHVQLELTRMMDRVIEETASRGKAESDKASIEGELEQLSSQLFAEANSMVAIERKERLKAERKMEELERNFQDIETMMTGQSAQMRDLGSKIDDLELERDELQKQVEELQHQLQHKGETEDDDHESAANASTISIRSESIAGTPAMVPSSLPDIQSYLSSSVSSQPSLLLQMPLSGGSNVPGTPGAAPARAIVFAHPIQFLSFELPPFQEFVLWTKSLARTRRAIMGRPILDPNSSAGSYGNYTGFPAPYAATTLSQANSYPGYMSEAERQVALRDSLQLSQYLSSPFIKRIMEEDSDPTLRLESAPGLSFFSRRQIANAIIDGDLAIEPAFTSLPSDKCSLCGTSLAKFIASHQATQPKDDPRRKLTRLATGWISSSISGTATPTREAQDRGGNKDNWSISALTDALGSLTPSRELGGFNFGMGGSSEKEKASQGHYTPYKASDNRPGTPSGNRSALGGGGATPSDRKASMPNLVRQASMSSAHRSENNDSTETNGAAKDGGQHDYVLTQSARQQGQIYLFRSLESSTRYTLCPHYCLPRLRAVCELWTYIRNIHKGLLLEDNPKIYPSPFGTSNEYTKLFRRLTANIQTSQTQVANNVIQDMRTPAPGLSRQLGEGVPPPMSTSAPQGEARPYGGINSPPILTTTNSIQGLASSVPVGLGLDMQNTREPTKLSSSSASSTTEDEDNGNRDSAIASAATDTYKLSSADHEGGQNATDENERVMGNTSKGASSAPNPPLPSRPPRSAARSSSMTPSTSGDGAHFVPSALSITALKGSTLAEEDKTPKPSPDLKQGENVTASSEPSSAIARSDAFAVPKSPRTPSGFAEGAAVPPALPPRSPRSARSGPGRISMPPSGLSLSTSFTSESGFPSGTTPGPTSASASSMTATGPISTLQADWQQKCWYEVIRLKEGVFWSRVGANYNKEQ